MVEKADFSSLMQNTFTSINMARIAPVIFELTNVKF